jgi:acyl-CoA dehydrogenase
MGEMENIIGDMVGRLLGDSVDPALLTAAEAGLWAGDLWKTLEENGLPSMLGDNQTGWREVFPVVSAAGRHCLPLPLPEAIAAGWLLTSAGLTVPEGLVGVAGFHKDDTLTLDPGGRAGGKACRVPWGRRLTHVVMIRDRRVALIDLAGCEVLPGANLVGEPRDTLLLRDARALVADCPPDLGEETARLLGALLRSGQMAGAIGSVLERSLAYAGERRQFGRAIGSFQAIKHMLAVLAEEAAAATIAAEHAFLAMDGGADTRFAVAVAKIRSGEAAGTAAAIGHQIHGAMGFAREHPLHHATRRLLAWRAEFGAEADWARRLAATVTPLGGAGLWPLITTVQEG